MRRSPLIEAVWLFGLLAAAVVVSLLVLDVAARGFGPPAPVPAGSRRSPGRTAPDPVSTSDTTAPAVLWIRSVEGFCYATGPGDVGEGVQSDPTCP